MTEDAKGWLIAIAIMLGLCFAYLATSPSGAAERGENPDAEYCSGPYCY